MKFLEWSSILLVVISYYLVAAGLMVAGFSLATVSCLSYGTWFTRKRIWSGVMLQGFFLIANILGLIRTGGLL